MRPTERLAAAAVLLMTVPAFVAFPLLGLWYVGRVWSAMSLVDRWLFCLAVPGFCAVLVFSFRRSLREASRVGSAEPTRSELAMMCVPLLAGTWALTRRWDILLSMTAWTVFDMVRAARRERCRRLYRST